MFFKAVPVTKRFPELGKWVTTIDTAGEHRVYRLMEHGWNMRDADADNSPNNNLPITHWLEICSHDQNLLFHASVEILAALINNHEWHKNHDEMYAGSELENINISAIRAAAI